MGSARLYFHNSQMMKTMSYILGMHIFQRMLPKTRYQSRNSSESSSQKKKSNHRQKKRKKKLLPHLLLIQLTSLPPHHFHPQLKQSKNNYQLRHPLHRQTHISKHYQNTSVIEQTNTLTFKILLTNFQLFFPISFSTLSQHYVMIFNKRITSTAIKHKRQ